jgi:hypothetical protein
MLLAACASGGAGGTGGGGDETERAVLADAVQRAGVQDVRVVSRETVTWRDGSLGCPQPGRLYTQALVRGWRMRVAAGERVLEYHGSTSGRWFFCPADRIESPLPRSAME